MAEYAELVRLRSRQLVIRPANAPVGWALKGRLQLEGLLHSAGALQLEGLLHEILPLQRGHFMNLIKEF